MTAILANAPTQAETPLHSSEWVAAGIGLHVNAHKTEYKCLNQTGDISTLGGSSLKLVDKFTYPGSRVSSTEKDIDTQLAKAGTATDRLLVIWKSDLTDKMKRIFFPSSSRVDTRCTIWTLSKRVEKKLDGNYTKMLRAILNKSWRQHPTKHQMYGYLPPTTKTIIVRRTGCSPEDLPEAMNDWGECHSDSSEKPSADAGMEKLSKENNDNLGRKYDLSNENVILLWLYTYSLTSAIIFSCRYSEDSRQTEIGCPSFHFIQTSTHKEIVEMTVCTQKHVQKFKGIIWLEYSILTVSIFIRYHFRFLDFTALQKRWNDICAVTEMIILSLSLRQRKE